MLRGAESIEEFLFFVSLCAFVGALMWLMRLSLPREK